jgi:hypothetical protein
MKRSTETRKTYRLEAEPDGAVKDSGAAGNVILCVAKAEAMVREIGRSLLEDVDPAEAGKPPSGK